MDLRQALIAASTRIEEKLTTNAVLQLQERSKRVAAALQATYELFFAKLEDLVNSGLGGDARGAPSMIAEYTSWKALSPSWYDQKFKSKNRNSLNFYIGMSDQMGTRQVGANTLSTYSQKHKRGRFRSGGRSKPFYRYVEGLANSPNATERFFGSGSIGYELKRPNGQIIKLAQDPTRSGVIGGLAEKPGKKFLEGLDGTVLTAQIWVFPKLTGLIGSNDSSLSIDDSVEQRIAKFMSKQDPANQNQWMKVSGRGGSGMKPIRPILTPLIKWYLQVGFRDVLRKINQ
jgi:hypothetical protein